MPNPLRNIFIEFTVFQEWGGGGGYYPKAKPNTPKNWVSWGFGF